MNFKEFLEGKTKIEIDEYLKAIEEWEKHRDSILEHFGFKNINNNETRRRKAGRRAGRRRK